MPRMPELAPENQFPQSAVKRSVQELPKPTEGPINHVYTLNLASAADRVYPWGKLPMYRDQQLREFWPTEPYLAGAITNIGFRSVALQWEVEHRSARVEQAVTDTLRTALAGDSFGWVPFMLKFSQDLCTQDNGAFIELIRDSGRDANSKFKGPMAPVLGIGHLDSNRCVRTGNTKFPVIYTDRHGKQHKLAWYQVIPFSDQPSAIESMNGIGFCGVSRVLRMAQLARSLSVYKDEKISGRHIKQINFVSGVSRQDIKDELERGIEEANNQGMTLYLQPRILASLDPEKPVSTATIDLAQLPDNFDFDEDMKWYISCLALGFGVDYQEFAPLPGGNIGSGAQSMILHRKGSGKGPAVLMRMLTEAFVNYGVLPKGADLRFNDKDEQEELERQNVRTKAMEEYAIAVNSGILTPEAAARDMVARSLWSEETINNLPEAYWAQFVKKPETENNQPVGSRGGNTIEEDAGRQDNGREGTQAKSNGRLRKALEDVTENLRAAVTRKEKEKPNIVLNIPETPAPRVNVLTPKLVDSEQQIVRDQYSNITTTRTIMKYDGYVVSRGGGDLVEPQAGSVDENEDGTIVINTPTPKRQEITIRMPKVKYEEMNVSRDDRGNIDHANKTIVYEEE